MSGVWSATWDCVGVMLVPVGHAAAGPVMIWVACPATRTLVTSRPELLPRSMVLLQLGPVVISVACASIKVIGTMQF